MQTLQTNSVNMQRKPGFPVANCSIKMPDSGCIPEGNNEEEIEQQQRRQQLINFGHSQWGFNNWNWAVTKQELDFVELTNGKYSAGVVAFVSLSVKTLDIHRENIGYATSNTVTKGFAIHKARKSAVTNALRETLLSFGGSVATELLELLEQQKIDLPAPPPAQLPPPPEILPENNQNLANKPTEPKNSPLNINKNVRKDSTDSNGLAMRSPHPVKNTPVANGPLPLREPPVAKAPPLPPPANRPPAHVAPAPRPPPAAPLPHPRPNSNDAKLEGMTEEEARAERKRRQRLAQEEFRQKQLLKNPTDEKQELNKNTSSFDRLMMEIPTQDIVIEETGDSAQAGARADAGKRKSPAPEGNIAKRQASISKLDIVQAD